MENKKEIFNFKSNNNNKSKYIEDIFKERSYEYIMNNFKSDKSNTREQQVWINKGRYQAYELSPYEETLVLDVDYIINSDKLLKTGFTQKFGVDYAITEIIDAYQNKTLVETDQCYTVRWMKTLNL